MDREYKQEAPMDVYNSRLTAKHARRARAIGDGDLSKGIRRAIEIAHEFIASQQKNNSQDQKDA